MRKSYNTNGNNFHFPTPKTVFCRHLFVVLLVVFPLCPHNKKILSAPDCQQSFQNIGCRSIILSLRRISPLVTHIDHD